MQIKNVRFIVAAITTFSAYAVYVSRVNLSIAIIAMVDDHHHSAERAPTLPVPLESNSGRPFERGNNVTTASTLTNELLVNETQHRTPLTTIFPTSKNSVKAPLISQNKFKWDQAEQGHILGAFFYGYIIFQVPGARMAESVGAKWIIMAANAGSAVISLAFPLSTQLNSIHLLLVLRFAMGLCQSAFFPAAYVLFCRWLPERERSVLLPIMFIGSNVGSISTYTVASWLISADYGWPSVFYLSGLVCLLVTALWCLFGSNGPEDNWLIGDEERRFILRSVSSESSENSESNSLSGETATGKLAALESNETSKGDELVSGFQPKQPSWSKLLRSVPIWTLILSMYGNEWSNVVICYEFPTYLNSALSFPIEQNGVINSFFQLTYALASPVMSSLGAYLLARHLFGMRKIHVRKLFQSLATFGQMICFLSVPICGANRGLIIMFMFAAVLFKACANAGDIMVAGDLSPEYAGTIFAFANSFGNTAGFFVPNLAGVFVSDAYAREQWTPFWLTTAAIMAGSGLIFLVFGETSRQDFGCEPTIASTFELAPKCCSGIGETKVPNNKLTAPRRSAEWDQ